MREKTNKEDVFDLIQKHPEGLDDDDISAMTGITPPATWRGGHGTPRHEWVDSSMVRR